MVTPYHTKREIKLCGSFLGYNPVYFHQEVIDFRPIYFPHILSIMESLACFHGIHLIVQSLYVHLKDRKPGWK